MRPRLYMNEFCPMARAVLMTAKALEVTLEVKLVCPSEKISCVAPGGVCKDQPQHSVPALEDNGYIIWDSHSIIAYLVGKYGMDDSLYPRNLKKRAVIDERLLFDSGVIQFSTKTVMNPLIYGVNRKSVSMQQKESLEEIYSILEEFFEKDSNTWIAGNELSIADLCLITSVTSFSIIAPIDSASFPCLTHWIRVFESLPVYSINRDAIKKMNSILRCKLY